MNNPERVSHTNESFPVEVWQRYASPVWSDINPSRTLTRNGAKEQNDERHICPLQLQVIERALELWSNPGDTVLSPFAGIGAEGYVALADYIIALGEEYGEVSCVERELVQVAAVCQRIVETFGGGR